MYKKSSRFQKWSKLLGKESREREEARDARIDNSSGRKLAPATPGEEFRRTVEKLRIATCFLRRKLDEFDGEPGWQGYVRKASEIRAQWAHLSDGESDPGPIYEDFLRARRAYDELLGVTAALFDPEAAVVIALIELNELRKKHADSKPDHFQQDVEQRAEGLLAICEEIKEQIGDAEYSLGHLIFDAPAFDAHYDRYHDENPGRG